MCIVSNFPFFVLLCKSLINVYIIGTLQWGCQKGSQGTNFFIMYAYTLKVKFNNINIISLCMCTQWKAMLKLSFWRLWTNSEHLQDPLAGVVSIWMVLFNVII
jgi:hypothetical protein